MSEQQSTCTSCGGTGGRTETTTHDGVLRQTWRTCTACRGTGAR